MTITTKNAFLISLGGVTAGFVFSAFKGGPYAEYAAAVVALFGAYGYKRLQQRQAKYNDTSVAPK
jgi:ABC-type Mn2+/Zn2+ transport system permease subunit